MASNATRIQFGVGRLVQGSLYTGSSTNMDGQPLVYKTGANAGQPRLEYYFAVAFPKNGTTDFRQTTWGQQMDAVAKAGWPQGQHLAPGFAWKVTDGDSAIPNKKGGIPNQKEGFPGHWIVGYKGSLAPRVATTVGCEPRFVTEENFVNLGDYIQVNGSVETNANTLNPGIYVNHDAVCLVGYGQRIVSGPDIAEMGFGGVQLPPGASTVPQAAAMPAPPAPQAPAALKPTVPEPAILQPPMPPAPPAPPADPQYALGPAAEAGHTVANMLAWGGGWTPEVLVQHGRLVRIA